MEPRLVDIAVHPDTEGVYIGRPGKWGNPFEIGKDGSREQVIEKYRVWIIRNRELIDQIGELYGKTLICHCAPLPCHGDVLIALVDAWKREAHKQCELKDAFCPSQVVKLLAELKVPLRDIAKRVQEWRGEYPCLFKARIVEGLGCADLRDPETGDYRQCKHCRQYLDADGTCPEECDDP